MPLARSRYLGTSLKNTSRYAFRFRYGTRMASWLVRAGLAHIIATRFQIGPQVQLIIVQRQRNKGDRHASLPVAMRKQSSHVWRTTILSFPPRHAAEQNRTRKQSRAPTKGAGEPRSYPGAFPCRFLLLIIMANLRLMIKGKSARFFLPIGFAERSA